VRKGSAIDAELAISQGEFDCSQPAETGGMFAGIARANAGVSIFFPSEQHRARNFPSVLLHSSRKRLVQNLLRGDHILAHDPERARIVIRLRRETVVLAVGD